MKHLKKKRLRLIEEKELIINDASPKVIENLISDKFYFLDNNLERFSDFEMMYFRKTRGSKFLKTYKDVYDYMVSCVTQNNEQSEAFLGKINKKMAKNFKKIANLNVANYSLGFCKSCIKHIYEKHYIDENKSQCRIKLNYLFMLPLIIENFSEAVKGTSKSVVVIQTKINGENYRCAIRCNNRVKTLNIVSFYKVVPLSKIVKFETFTNFEDIALRLIASKNSFQNYERLYYERV